MKNYLCPKCKWLGPKEEADVQLYAHANISTVVVFCPLCGVRIDSQTSQTKTAKRGLRKKI